MNSTRYGYCRSRGFVIRFASESSATSGPKSLSLFLRCFVSALKDARTRASNRGCFLSFFPLPVRPHRHGCAPVCSLHRLHPVHTVPRSNCRTSRYLSQLSKFPPCAADSCNSKKTKLFYEGRSRRGGGTLAATRCANPIPGPAQPHLLIAPLFVIPQSSRERSRLILIRASVSMGSIDRLFLSWLEQIRIRGTPWNRAR